MEIKPIAKLLLVKTQAKRTYRPKVRSQERRHSTEKAGSYTVPGQSLNPSGGCEVSWGNEGPGSTN